MEKDKNTLMASEDKLMKMVRMVVDELKTDQSFFVADFSDVIKKYNYWKLKLPRVHPYYAVKTNSELPFLRFMSSLGAHFDCASKDEIDWVLSIGATPSEIIYAHTAKFPSHLEYAKSKGVDLMTFDSEAELLKTQKIFPTARLVLRFRVPNVDSHYQLDSKFGCDMEECAHLLKLAHHLGLSVVGTCFHVGALCNEPAAYSRAIEMSRKIFDLAKDIGYDLTLLDIGGGFSGHAECYAQFDEICKCINKSLDEHFSNDSNLEIIAEPGCYFAGSAFTLCTCVLGKRKVKDASNGAKESIMYYLNDGIYGSFFDGYELYNVNIKPLLDPSDLSSRPVLPSKLWGYTCCPMDCIGKNIDLPEVNVGEYLIFDNMGSYTISIVSNFNGVPRPIVRYVYSDALKGSKLTEDQINGNFLPIERNGLS